MDHPEVRQWIADAVAAPGGLTALAANPTPETAAILDHLRSCVSCMAEWRAWSVVSLGFAAAAPDDLTLRPAARAQILDAITARPRQTVASATPPPATYSPAAPIPAGRPSVVPGGRSGRTAGMTSAASRAARRDPAASPGGAPFRWLALGAAAAALLFVAGAVLGRPLGLGGGEPAPTSGAIRILATAADVLQGQGYSLAHLETPDGTPGGFVAVSPGSGRLVVVSRALAEPSGGARYLCYLERDGIRTAVGPMHFDGGVAYWAGQSTPPDLGLTGDVFLVQLDTPGSVPALSGTF
jgi:hypothetical protein